MSDFIFQNYSPKHTGMYVEMYQIRFREEYHQYQMSVADLKVPRVLYYVGPSIKLYIGIFKPPNV